MIMEDEDKILNERKSEARTRSMRKFTRSTGEKRIFLTEAFNDGNFAERRDSRSFRTFFLFVIEIDFNCTKIDSTKINLFPFVPIFFFFSINRIDLFIRKMENFLISLSIHYTYISYISDLISRNYSII